jgi:Chain length determinant protein
MEIRDYLRAIRRILWLVIAVPIAAALLSGGFMELQPSIYEADASVVVPAISGNASSSSAATQYVAGFKDVLVSQPVLTEVSQKYQIPVSDLAAGLSASTITASSNIIHVVLAGKHGQNLVGAVREATVDAMNAIAQPRLADARNALQNAQTLLNLAETNINNWVGTNGTSAPQAAYNATQSELFIANANLARAKTVNDVKAENGALALITLYTKQLATLGTEVTQFQELTNARAAALSANDHATQEVVDAQALVATDESPATVSAYSVGRLSKLSNTIKFAGIAFALGLLMMLGLILVLELMRSGRSSVAKPEPAQGGFIWDPELAPRTGAVPTPATASAPASPGQTATPAAPRDPWRPSPAATLARPSAAAAVPSTTPYGNGNGHATGNGNGNGNGHTKGNGNGHAIANGNGNGGDAVRGIQFAPSESANGNGHANGNGQADRGAVVDPEADPQQAVRRP